MHRITAVLLLAFTAALPLTGSAQTTIAPPTSGLIVGYQYWPEQFVQFVGTELPYSMIELDVNRDGKTPVYNVVLTQRGPEPGADKRIQYSNSEAIVAAAAAQGNEAHKTEIAFEEADATNTGSISTLRLSLADGRPLRWRFVQGSDISEQGSGLTALPLIPIPVLAYREQGAVAGEGTALQIGNTISIAEVWKEISKPPYFVGYRGAYTQSAHRITFAPGRESWTVASGPSSLAIGSTWELDGAHGAHRTLRIERADGNHFLISATDRMQPTVHSLIDANRTDDSWAISSIRYSPVKEGDKHSMTLKFGTPVGPGVPGSTLELVAGKKASIAKGTLTLSGTPMDRTALLDMSIPSWLSGRVLTEETTASTKGFTIEAHLRHKP